MQEYCFDEAKFRTNFKANEYNGNSADKLRLTHVTDKRFKLYPYKATSEDSSPIVRDIADVVGDFFRKTLNLSVTSLSYNDLCEKLLEKVDIDDADDVEMFRDIIISLFFKEGKIQANNIGLYAYQINVDKKRAKSAERIAEFLFCVFGLDEQDKVCIQKAEDRFPFNVLERLIVDSIETKEGGVITEADRYFKVKRSIEAQFKKDFRFMLSIGMTSIDDFSNLLAFYYFYYVSQCSLTLDSFGDGDRDELKALYFALDWEKVSKNRLCCKYGWNILSNSIYNMFSHAITLEILNQTNVPMMDYIDLKVLADSSEEMDCNIENEVKRAEKEYTSYIDDFKKFNEIKSIEGANKTDTAIRHLFECVLAQFKETDRKRVIPYYSDKFSEFCKFRFVKNRKKSGLVLNLTESDIIFLTKLALRDSNKIRLNELYKQYELRGVYLDTTSKALLQEFFTKMNLIDKKSDSGDAQYVKRIL